MRLPDYIVTAQTNLLRTKVRTFLTILAFFIGTFTLAMVTAFTQGVRAYIDTQLNAYGQPNMIDVTVGKSAVPTSTSGVPYYQATHTAAAATRDGQQYTLSDSDLTTIQHTAGVISAYPEYLNFHIDFVSYAGQPKYDIVAQAAYPENSAELAAGAVPGTQTDGLVLPYPYVEAFGAQTADELIGKHVQLQVTSAATGEPKLYNATITGVLPDTLHQPGAFLSYQLVDQMAQYQLGSKAQFSDVSAFVSKDATPKDRLAVKNALQAQGYDAQTYDDLLSNFSTSLSVVTAGLSGFAAIALLAATIGIVNTLLMAVLERTQEIGLLKALGMRRGGITLIYLVEAASIGFWGGIIGVGFARFVGLILNPILSRTLFKGIGTAHVLAYPLPFMLAIILGAMVVGLLAGTLPAIRAGRLDPISALRHE